MKDIKNYALSKFYVLLFLIVLLGGFVRFYKIDVIPPGLYIDEVSSAYNGYTILRYGKDEHGASYPLWFEAFGEYKMPALIYSMAGSMAIFGKNEFAVRFPSALTGTLTILLLYFFTKELLEKDTLFPKRFRKDALALLAAFLLAISPWHIQFSRGGFDATIALFFFILACFLTVKFWHTQKSLFLFSGFFVYCLTIYSYNAYRLITPIVLVGILLLVIVKKRLPKRQLIFGIILLAILLAPFIAFTGSDKGIIRFNQTSAFAEYPIRSFLEKPVIYPMIFLKNYISYFSLHFLFNFGDGIGRHQIPSFGVLPRWQLPFLLIGIGYLFTLRKTRVAKVVFLLLLIAPLSAAFARPSPHALRSLLMVIPLEIIIALGMIFVLQRVTKWKKVVFIGIAIPIIIFESLYYFHYYYAHYPKVNINDWGGGYKQVVESATRRKKDYQEIVVDGNLGFAAPYFNFYNDSLHPIIAGETWQRPKDWSNKRVLHIRPYYGTEKGKKLIENILLPNQNSDIFAQFWEL